MTTREEMLIEADRRGLLTGNIKSMYDEAVKRGMIKVQGPRQEVPQSSNGYTLTPVEGNPFEQGQKKREPTLTPVEGNPFEQPGKPQNLHSRAKLETALRNAHKAGDTAAAKKLANALKNGQYAEAGKEPETQYDLSFLKPREERPEPAKAKDPDEQEYDLSFLEPKKPKVEPQEDMAILRDLDAAFSKIPGAPALGEFAAAANRSIFDMIDFLGPDTANAILEIAGSDKRVPTMRESFGSEGGYMEEGLARDVVQEAGELAPQAVAFGQMLRTMAGRMPAFSQGESAARGTARQLGNSTAKQDATAGALAGAGGAAGQEVGGDTGRLIGSTAGAFATAPLEAVKAVARAPAARKLLKEAAPSPNRLKDEARQIYTRLDDMGVTINQPSVSQLSDDITKTVRRQGFNARIHPKVSAVLDEVAASGDKPMTVSEMDIMRRVAQSAARSIEPDEARLGGIIMQKIDDFLDDIPASALEGTKEQRVGPLFREARAYWSQAKKGELIEQAVEKAKNQASGFENGIRTQFRALINNPKKMRGFTKDEKDALKLVVRGGTAENLAKAIGKFGFTEGQATNMLLGSLGVAGGAAVGGPAGAAAIPVIGQVAKNVAQRLTQRNAQLADLVVRAGTDGRKIVSAYMRSVPKGERSTEELTGLLLKSGADFKSLQKSQNQLIANSALAASLITNASPPPEDSEKDSLNGQ